MSRRVSTQIGIGVSAVLLSTLLMQATLTRLLVGQELEYARSEIQQDGLELLSLAVRGQREIDPRILSGLGSDVAIGVYDQNGRVLARTAQGLPAIPAHVLERVRRSGARVVREEHPRVAVRAVRGLSGAVPLRYVAIAESSLDRRIVTTRRTVATVITICSGIVALLATLALTKRIQGRLLHASEVVQSVAQGNFEARLPVTGDDEVGQLASNFNQMAERLRDQIVALREEDARRRRIFADWTHEIATPLSSVLGYLESLHDQGLSQARRARYLQRAHEQARALESLSDDLSVLSRVESEGMRIERSAQDLVALLSAETEALSVRAPELAVSLSAPKQALINLDARRVAQVLRNLMSNAQRYARKSVVVRCLAREDGYAIEVVDDGPGIDPAHLPHVTESFYRADASRDRRTGGRGLGLSIAKHIVEAHGGTLSVESDLGVGTTVRFVLRDARS